MDLSQIYTTHEIQSWEEAKKYFKKLRKGWAFRGQLTDAWELKTTIERLRSTTPYYENEWLLKDEFSRRVHLYTEPTKLRINDTIELLAMMQHHGAPTRLLDFTHSPYIASFFAFENPNDKSEKVAIWAIDIHWLRTVTNLMIEQKSHDPLLKLHSLFYKNTYTWNIADVDALIFSNMLDLIAPIEPFFMNERMTIQQGIFLVPGNLKKGFMANLQIYLQEGIKDHLTKVVIANKLRQEALADLHLMNISRTSLFPGIDGFAQSFNTRFEI